MDEKQLGVPGEDFDLDDILKEFGIPKEEKEDEDVRIWDGVMPEDVKPSVPSDTVRLDDVTRAVRAQTRDTDDGTRRFTPVGQSEEPQAAPVAVAEKPGVEPFSEKWEPEYENPISDYVPPEPIVFRPKNRLRELKRKLVEGPERRYYELEEIGIGKLQAGIFVSWLVTLVAVGSVVMYQLELVSPERMRLLIFGQGLMLLLAGLLGSYQLLAGLGDLFHGKFSLNTLLVFSFLACCADGILCLQQLRVPCCAAFCLQVTMSLYGECQRRGTEMAQMDTMRRAVRLNGLTLTPECYEGRPGYLRCEGQVEDFMEHYDAPSGPQKALSIYSVIALFLSIGCGVAAWMLRDLSMGLQVFSAALLVAAPASAHIALSRPAALLQRRLKKHGCVICGWRGVKGLSRNAVFPLTDTDLFPAGSAKLNGVKFYGDRDPDQVVAYAAALIGADGGSMAPLVTQLLESRSGYHYDVTQFQSYPGGIGGIVDGEAVLAGTLNFMQSMGVEMPKGTKVNQAVYVAIDGQLGGVFAVSYARVKSSVLGLGTLCSYRGLTPVMVTGDFMLTDSFLRGKFGVNTRRIAFPDRAAREELARKQPEAEAAALALTTQEGLAGMAYAVTGSRALRSSSITGTVIHILGGALGLAIIAALVAVNADYLLSPGNILLYQLVWLIPGWLITEWTRSV